MTARVLVIENSRREKADRWRDVLRGDKTGFEVCIVPKIGRGIKTTKRFQQKEVLMRYFAELITAEELARREARGPKEGHFYRYKFQFQQKTYFLDATREDGTYGRLMNHSKRNPNVRAKPVEIDGGPAIIFVAMRDLEVGEELRYDYGERDPEVVEANPWLKW